MPPLPALIDNLYLKQGERDNKTDKEGGRQMRKNSSPITPS